MTVQGIDIAINGTQLQALERLAREEGLPLSDLVREAVDMYLIQRQASRGDARVRMEELLAKVRGRVPMDIPTEEIEADITIARKEVRQARRAARSD
jgi:Ribbon-helix-helix domain